MARCSPVVIYKKRCEFEVHDVDRRLHCERIANYDWVSLGNSNDWEQINTFARRRPLFAERSWWCVAD